MGLELGRRHAEQIGQVAERYRAAAQLECGLPFERELGGDGDTLVDARERDAVRLPRALDEQHVEQRECEREPQDRGGAAPGLALNLERAAERLDVALHGVEPDTTTREIAHALCGG